MKDLVIKARSGDCLAKEEILKRLLPLVKYSIRRYYYIYNEFEDLLQVGYLKILDLIETYDVDSEVYFQTYVKLNLKYMYLDMNKKKVEDLILNSPNENGLEPVDLLVCDFDLEEFVLKNLGLEEIDLSLLSPRERQVIDLYYFKDKSMVEIKDKLGISYRTVVNLKVNGISKLRKAFKIYWL